MTSRAVIAGSGPSLLDTDLTRVPADTAIVRVNNFFFEPEYYLGAHADRVYFSADPRSARFYAATLRQAVSHGVYSIGSCTSPLPRAHTLRIPACFDAFNIYDPKLTALVDSFRAETGVKPTSGVMAMVDAVQNGANQLYITGIDFYLAAMKYAFDTPPQFARLLAPNANPQGYDTLLHNHELDFAIVRHLLDNDTSIERISSTDDSATNPLGLDLAPALAAGEHLMANTTKVNTVGDWVRFDGLWSVDALVALRRVRRAIKRMGSAVSDWPSMERSWP